MGKENEVKGSRRKYLSKAGTLGAVLAWGTPNAVAADGETLEQSELLGQTPETITLQSSRVYDSVPYFRDYEYTDFVNESGEKYLIADVKFESRIDTPRPELSSFRLKVDGGLYEPTTEIHNVPLCRILDRSSIHDGRAYRSEPMDLPEGLVEVPPWMKRPTFSFGFVVPQRNIEQASIVFRRNDGEITHWGLSDDEVARLGSSGGTQLIEANGKMTADSSLQIEMEIKNDANVTKYFGAAVRTKSMLGNHYVTATVPPQSRVSHIEKVPLGAQHESTSGEMFETRISSSTGNEKVIEVGNNGS